MASISYHWTYKRLEKAIEDLDLSYVAGWISGTFNLPPSEKDVAKWVMAARCWTKSECDWRMWFRNRLDECG